MRKVKLQGTPIETTAVGFGCGSLSGAGTAQASLRVLEAAYGAGMRHFDVAPSYGYGVSETLLGEFAQNKRDKITITTKYGIQVAQGIAQRQGLMSLAKKVVKAFPPVRRMLQRRAAAMFSPASFTPADVQAGLEESLRKLKTDYIDLYLLHEAGLETAAREDLIGWLQQQVGAGKIRACGVGSELAAIGTDASRLHPLLRVVQFHSSVRHPNVRDFTHAEERVLITHGSLRAVPLLRAHVQSRPAELAKLQAVVPGDPLALLPSVLLQVAQAENPRGLVLFSTSKAGHVPETMRPLENGPLAPDQLASAREVLSAMVRSAAGEGKSA